MYSWEELKTLGFFIAAAILGRLLFYRSLIVRGSFKQRVKIRMLQWLWELPVIMAIGIVSHAIAEEFTLKPNSGLLIALVMGFIGLETIKVWMEDYLETKIIGRNPGRREEDDEHKD